MFDTSRQANELADIQSRLVFLKVGLLMILVLLGLRLWQLQIRDGAYYQDLARDNRTRSIVLEPARGLLHDRNGELLANNIPSFQLYVSLEDVQDRDALMAQLPHYVDLNMDTLADKLSPKYRRGRVKIKSGLSLKEAALIESHRIELPGVAIQPEYQRHYPLGTYASHVIGYVGEISEAQLKNPEFVDLQAGRVIGQHGVERTLDAHLLGETGQKVIEVDAFGYPKRSLSIQPPLAGDDLYLTLDIRLQRLAEDLLGEESGAIVALDPWNGDVLALASRPGFNPNDLSGGISPQAWQQLLQDARHPLTNRAIQGQYPPGSTFKIVMAAALLETKTMTTEESLTCNGTFPFGRRVFRDWKRGGHGSVALNKALAESCDVYFYKVGNQMGIDPIAAYSRQFGLGEKTGIALPSERAGLVPSSEWKQKNRGERWYPGETISISIGQGFLSVTPIQMAKAVSIVATNGHVVQPRLLKGIRLRRTGNLKEEPEPPTHQLPISAKTFSDIKEGLAAVVTRGTAKLAQSSIVSIAGKTGTAQVIALKDDDDKTEIAKKHRDHAWFVAFAPVEQPKIAVAVIVEHMGHGGSAAAPLAKALIEAYINFGPPQDLNAL
ncbi:MAG: penicillin-binding protein 2 [Nitrospirota bacterium]|nr:penicillin-binding protein 2 [Nitrospirota bacterium]